MSLQLTVQFPFLNVFSSFILPLRACQKRAFDDIGAVGAGAERGVNTLQVDRSPQGLRSTKIRAWSPQPMARPDMSCGVLATLVVWPARVSRSMELSIGYVRQLMGAFANRTRKVEFFHSNYRRVRSNFACARLWAWPSRCTGDFSPKLTQTGNSWRFPLTARFTQNWHRMWSVCRDGSLNRRATCAQCQIRAWLHTNRWLFLFKKGVWWSWSTNENLISLCDIPVFPKPDKTTHSLQVL